MKTISGILWALAVLAVCGLLAVGVWYFTQHSRDAHAAAQGDATARSQAAGQAEGHDAVEAVHATDQADAATDAQTRKGNDAIAQSKGAAAPVPPDVARAGIAALCLRDSYVDQPACIKLRRIGPG